MKRNWWKYLSGLILIYVLFVGMLTPLKPGIVSLKPMSATGGQKIELTVGCYNAHLNSVLQNQAFLKLSDQKVIRAVAIEEKSSNEARLTFNLPKSLSTGKAKERATLILNNEVDGSLILPNALLLTADQSALEDVNTISWSNFDVSQLFKVSSFRFPYRNILNETIRNTFFHVAIWFAMFILLIIALVASIQYLIKKELRYDYLASSFTHISIVYGLIGLATGAVWAKFTWGAFWTTDVKLNMAAISVAIYLAYSVLRKGIKDVDAKARLSASYNIFAFVMMIPLIFIIPRLTDSLHPGNGGNPALGGEDLDNTLRMVFYPAIIGFTLLGIWIGNLSYRAQLLFDKSLEE